MEFFENLDDGSKVNIDKKQNHNDQTSIDSKLIDSKITKSDKVDIDEDEDDEEEDDEDEYDDDYSDDHDDGTMAAGFFNCQDFFNNRKKIKVK